MRDYRDWGCAFRRVSSRALRHWYAHDIVHRDIKPQNILRCDDVWKIADFGISKLMNNPLTGYTFQGAFTAPWRM